MRIPGVGLYRNAAGEVAPASHMNFIIANGVVVVPVYGTPTQDAALASLAGGVSRPQGRRRAIARAVGCGDAGGGSFHCITQQEPL